MANDSTNEDDAYVVIGDLDPSAGVDGTDLLYAQKEDGTDNKTTAAQMKEYCTPPLAAKNTAGLVSATAQEISGKKTFDNGIATTEIAVTGNIETNEIAVTEKLSITGKTSVGSYTTASCATAASTKQKTVTIANYTLETGDIIGVTFTYANTYGDSTASTKTYPTLKINSETAYPICDSRGNTVGTGAWNAGNYIELRFTGTKFIIINSDVRQSVSGTSGYTIYSNGKLVQWGRVAGVIAETSGTVTFTKTFSSIPNITVGNGYWYDSNQSYLGFAIKAVSTTQFNYSIKNVNTSYYNYWKAEGTI